MPLIHFLFLPSLLPSPLSFPPLPSPSLSFPLLPSLSLAFPPSLLPFLCSFPPFLVPSLPSPCFNIPSQYLSLSILLFFNFYKYLLFILEIDLFWGPLCDLRKCSFSPSPSLLPPPPYPLP